MTEAGGGSEAWLPHYLPPDESPLCDETKLAAVQMLTRIPVSQRSAEETNALIHRIEGARKGM